MKLKWIISNGIDKAILLTADSCDEAIKKGNYLFYSPFPVAKRLNVAQVYDGNICHLENKIFKKVQFCVAGGISTTYDANIHTQPTPEQIKFLDNREIEYVLLYDEKYK